MQPFAYRLQQESSGQPLPPNAYDAQGNLTNHPWIGQMSYDGEGKIWRHIKGGTTVEFTDDGEGRRVKKGNEICVYDAFGNLAAEYGGTASSTGTRYLTTDHLGSTRLITKQDGTVDQRIDYLPFGETIPGGANFGNRPSPPTGPRQKFTGKDRDGETGLDYFGARYMSAAQGRFTSIGPIAGSLVNPQSLNGSAYAVGTGSLHRLLYYRAAACVIHHLWLVKPDIRLPLIHGFGALLALALTVGMPVVTIKPKTI